MVGATGGGWWEKGEKTIAFVQLIGLENATVTAITLSSAMLNKVEWHVMLASAVLLQVFRSTASLQV